MIKTLSNKVPLIAQTFWFEINYKVLMLSKGAFPDGLQKKLSDV